MIGLPLPRITNSCTARSKFLNIRFAAVVFSARTYSSRRSYSTIPLVNMKTQQNIFNEPQQVDAALTSSAIFLVLSITKSANSVNAVRSVLTDIADLTKNVSIRDLNAQLACTVGIGSNVWDELTNLTRPRELHRFKEVKGDRHTAPSTPGDLLFHIRSNRRDMCFEFERQLLNSLGTSVQVVDETIGFRYFDLRDLLGFVDGTANPVGPDIDKSVLAVDESEVLLRGSYVVVQKYVHDLSAWQNLTVEQQEQIIGRTKLDNIELDDATEGQRSHKTLGTITDADGVEHEILRDNMPFGSPGHSEFGTYFIGYTRNLWVIEQMLERMFIGDPPGMHDRILDYSTPLTGNVFFVPPADVLMNFD
ncbi:putative deferrochelatase/peroxidase YfeX [Limtongia smithiae]|uniref:putative deferrochelatase/peroxidase YfeX n=1 Tax=Limtongia smithiae TaxID=1125753 RepID=UPI0034CFB670